QEARSCIERAATEGEAEGLHDLVVGCRATLAWIEMDRGDWEAAAAEIRLASTARRLAAQRSHPATMLAHAAAARHHLHLQNSAEAARELAEAMASRAVSTYVRPFPAVKGRAEV